MQIQSIQNSISKFQSKVGRGGRRGRRSQRRREERMYGPLWKNTVHEDRKMVNEENAYWRLIAKRHAYYMNLMIQPAPWEKGKLATSYDKKGANGYAKPVTVVTAVQEEFNLPLPPPPSPSLVEETPTLLLLDFPSNCWSDTWNEVRARYVLAAWKASGESGRAFAKAHGFPESRLRSWSKKLGVK